MNFQLHRFHREKSLQFTLVTYPAFTIAGFLAVIASHGNYNAVVLAALLFLLGPLAVVYLNKNRFVRPATVFITDTGFRIEEEGFPTFSVNWQDVESYQTEFTRSLLGSGYNLKFLLNDGTKRHFILYEPVFTGASIREDSVLYQLCISIGHHNRRLAGSSQPIELRPNLFSLKPAAVIILILGVLLLTDIAFRLSHHQGSRQLNIGGSLMIAVVMAIAVFGRKRTDDTAYQQMQDLMAGI